MESTYFTKNTISHLDKERSKFNKNSFNNSSDFSTENRRNSYANNITQSQIKSLFLKSPQIPNIVLSDDPFPYKSNRPHVNSELVISFLRLFHWSLLVPDKIRFDRESGRFHLQKGSQLVRLASKIWLLCITLYISLIFFNDVEEKHTVKVIISKLMWACYTLFDLNIIYCLRHKGDRIAKMLSEGNKISNLCDSVCGTEGLFIKKTNQIKYTIYSVCLFGGIYTVAYLLIVILELTAGTTNLYNIFLEFTDASSNYEISYQCNPKNILCTIFERCSSSVRATIIIMFWLPVSFTVELIWVVFLIMTASWGYYFTRLFKLCVEIIKGHHVDIHEGIQIYTKITTILEEFNDIFGNTLLWIIIASVLYIASTIGELLAGFNNGLSYDIINATGFIPFIATLYTASELHRTGNILPSVIKRQFMGLRFKDNEHMLEIMHGTNVIQYDILANNLGFKGAGFFTISYNFVGSLVGVIITYSLVTVQFKLGEIPIFTRNITN